LPAKPFDAGTGLPRRLSPPRNDRKEPSLRAIAKQSSALRVRVASAWLKKTHLTVVHANVRIQTETLWRYSVLAFSSVDLLNSSFSNTPSFSEQSTEPPLLPNYWEIACNCRSSAVGFKHQYLTKAKPKAAKITPCP
jgi:hypothetical protein